MTRRDDHQLLEADRILLGQLVARAFAAENQTPGSTSARKIRRQRSHAIVARGTDGPVVWTLERLRWQVCARKQVFGEHVARMVAERMRDRGERVSPYRCPFSDEGGRAAHWHVGHAPRMETVVMVARAIRGLPIIDDRPLPVAASATVRV